MNPFQEITSHADKGDQTQRVLWASTSTKNPQLSAVLYVEELIGPDTVNTIPPAAMEAFRDHGRPRASLEEDVAAAQTTMEALGQAGLLMDEITGGLLTQGLRLFAEAFDKRLNATHVKSPSEDDRQRLGKSTHLGSQTK